jgi:hypothetical protein
MQLKKGLIHRIRFILIYLILPLGSNRKGRGGRKGREGDSAQPPMDADERRSN